MFSRADGGEADFKRKRKLFLRALVCCLVVVAMVRFSLRFFDDSDDGDDDDGGDSSTHSELKFVTFESCSVMRNGFSGCSYGYNSNIDTVSEINTPSQVAVQVTRGYSWCSGSSSNSTVAVDGGVDEETAASGQDDGGSDAAAGGTTDAEFSGTNNQESGVDESDLVKTDSNGNIFTLTTVVKSSCSSNLPDPCYSYVCDQRLSITHAHDNGTLTPVSLVSLQSFNMTSADDMFVDTDHSSLVVIGMTEVVLDLPDDTGSGGGSVEVSATMVLMFDISDLTNPVLSRTVVIEGYFNTARKVGSVAYLVTSRNSWQNVRPVPFMGVSSSTDKITEMSPVCRCDQVGHLENSGFPSSSFTTVSAIEVREDIFQVETETVAVGSWSSVYASTQSIYIAQTDYGWSCDSENFGHEPRTLFVRFAISGLSLSVANVFSVRGQLNDQFSMSEVDNVFRVATTTGSWSTVRSNSVFTFDVDEPGDNQEPVGSLMGLAEGETIQSARFEGDRLYLVTFVETDPLFVIDLSDKTNIQVLGELKIPGFSTYLHTINSTHVVGLGRHVALDQGSVVELGVKVSLFDVSDELHPSEVYHIIFGERGTQSPALDEHKAFQFWPAESDYELPMIAFPITIAEVEEMEGVSEQESLWTSGDPVSQGVLILGLAASNFTTVRDMITHHNQTDFELSTVTTDDGYTYTRLPYYDADISALDISRALRRGDYVYCVSENAISSSLLYGNATEHILEFPL